MGGKGAEAVGFELAPASLSQSRPDGNRAVSSRGPPHGVANLQDFFSPFSPDNPNRNMDPRLLVNAANARGPSIPPIDVQSMGRSETTTVTGLVPDTGTGSTAWSETNGFHAHEDQPMTVPSYVLEDKDGSPWPFEEWSRDILGLVPGAHYPETLEGEADADLCVPTEE